MALKRELHVGIVEDDAYFNKMMQKFIKGISHSGALGEFDVKIYPYFTGQNCMLDLDLKFDIMILDYTLINEEDNEWMTAEPIIKELHEENPDCAVIIVTGQTDPFVAARLYQMGAYDYVDKNTSSLNRLQNVVTEIANKILRKDSRHSIGALKRA